MEVLVLTVLLALLLSISLTLFNVPWLLITFVPEAAPAPTVNAMVKVSESPALRLPKFHSPAAKLPRDGVTDDTLTPAGKVKLFPIRTPVALLEPLLAAVKTYTKLFGPEPAVTGSTDSVWLNAISTTLLTVNVAVAVPLLPTSEVRSPLILTKLPALAVITFTSTRQVLEPVTLPPL